jgi:hypothetical protein
VRRRLSALTTLVIPKPASKYTVRVRRYRFVPLDLTIRATPLGEDRAYRVCYRLKSKRRICLRGTLDGYSWNSSAEDMLDASTRNLTTFTTFTWYVGSRAVARKRARVK